ncbi:cell division ATP-binding protein FtsE [Salisediminibacterium halotolerans]|uniref:Cell division ATP-binding protein FtsE n=1 Tax=Salisediminibacterium halotolerans TaxID=517425 RepID=A0A1H9W1G3_9BACI|nr:MULTISPECIES: cell division ATP-binding protein FtsE [Salisediminibacterium]RLJ75476.1 cell division transport system ATP-binding protein [Actinophytocola xinjiangensis]RPE89329.1 cell division transport system ATP-binding protein [Salisediminibacterium halotolerans]TWG36089.1 cell division transport system ATP-binding protein [Salisediminibacterium halotolerans]SES27800.1 cell division transport system ATP-binding protein [Salisediminibacterium haloalkalitolerans]GEL07852.1 cell division A
MIQMQDVWKTYPNGVMAINGMTIHIDSGEFVYIVGSSGAGKSSFIKMLYREEKPTRGEIFIDDKKLADYKERHIPYLRRNMGVVFQDFKLLPGLTVFENIAFALEVIEEKKDEIKRRVMQVLDIVRLKNKARFYPHELSGGEQQRVAIARAIVNNPSVLIADEPTGNLDPDTSWEIMHILEEINDRGTTVLMATHNREIVNSMRKRVIAIEGGRIARDEVRGTYNNES